MREGLYILFISLGFLLFSSCGPKVTPVAEDGCYKIEGNEVLYTCSNRPNDESNASTPGYDGVNNPKALNLFRPGRFENYNVW